MGGKWPALPLILLAILAWPTGEAAGQTVECPSLATPANLKLLDQRVLELADLPPDLLQRKKIDELPIRVHLVCQSSGQGCLAEADAISAIDATNLRYQGANMMFFSCGSFNYISSDDFYDLNYDTGELDDLLAEHGAEDEINIFFVNSITFKGSSGIGGLGPLPPSADWVLVKNSVAADGNILSHEFGHYFGLLHVNGAQGANDGTDELVDGSNCTTAADRICDTPADPALLGYLLADTTCTYPFPPGPPNACNRQPPFCDANNDVYKPLDDNIMWPAYEECFNQFTIGQSNLANWVMSQDRGNLKQVKTPPVPTDLLLLNDVNQSIFVASQKITAGGTFAVTAGEHAGFQAGEEIVFVDGFRAEGGTMTARIIDRCFDTPLQ